jgi:hypothetical protein
MQQNLIAEAYYAALGRRPHESIQDLRARKEWFPRGGKLLVHHAQRTVYAEPFRLDKRP